MCRDRRRLIRAAADSSYFRSLPSVGSALHRFVIEELSISAASSSSSSPPPPSPVLTLPSDEGKSKSASSSSSLSHLPSSGEGSGHLDLSSEASSPAHQSSASPYEELAEPNIFLDSIGQGHKVHDNPQIFLSCSQGLWTQNSVRYKPKPNEGRRITSASTTSMKGGGFGHFRVKGREGSVRFQSGQDLNFVSKRRVPNGPDPIHNSIDWYIPNITPRAPNVPKYITQLDTTK
ncbi:hypothetical protein QJS04_geneDACA014588 [Acorus gramineus]|uniref:Uncharacterized protein n=1 Tax=Acorus gramineus TaxID=55184 RepID=A0AAV9ATK3_ACOGR|nr:hypothetical protein QJS04_geneDACA014588 [Acorus gramineus]